MKRLMLLALGLTMLGCPKPEPTPTPTPTPTPPPDTGCCSVPVQAAAGWRKITPKQESEDRLFEQIRVPYNALFIAELETKLGNLCGHAQSEALDLLEAGLLAKGLCADRWGEDSLMVLRPDGSWEEWKPVDSNGCWTQLHLSMVDEWAGPRMRCE